MAIKARIEIRSGNILAIESMRSGDCVLILCGGVDGQHMLAELLRIFPSDIEEGNGEPMHMA
jgi:hypothetical protein